PVIASDIQEYSRVICSALLSSQPSEVDIVSVFTERLQAGSPLLDALRRAVEPLVQFEREALQAARSGEPDAICSVLEHGSLLAAERGLTGRGSSELQIRLAEVTRRLALVGLSGSAAATA